MSALLPVEIKAGTFGHDTEIIIDGMKIRNARRYVLEGEVNEITILKIDLIALGPTRIFGDMKVDINIDQIPENLARALHEKLNDRFCNDRLVRKLNK